MPRPWGGPSAMALNRSRLTGPKANRLRPAGWTSADAAGLPIFAGLLRYDEVKAGSVDHAIRMTVGCTHDTYLWPARHAAGTTPSPMSADGCPVPTPCLVRYRSVRPEGAGRAPGDETVRVDRRR